MTQRVLLGLFLACLPALATTADPLAVAAGWAQGTSGGAGGSVDTVSDSTSLRAALTRSGAGLIFVKGSFHANCTATVGDKSLLGLPGAVIRGSLHISGSKTSFVRNVIVRNLTLVSGQTCAGDFGVGTCEEQSELMRVSYARGIWLDHLTLIDGLYSNLDIVHGSDSLTLSWIRQSYTRTDLSHQFANLIGTSDRNGAEDSLRLRFTWHHSLWGDNIRERMPRVRFGNAHLYNNVFASKTANYCIRAAWWSNLLIEANRFDSTDAPISLYDTNVVVESRLNRFFGTTGDTIGNGKAIAPPYAYGLDSAVDLVDLVVPAATGAGANLTWKSLPSNPVSIASAPATRALEISRRADRTVLRNRTPNALSIGFLSVSGQILSPPIALAPGASYQTPEIRGLRLLRLQSASGSATVLLPY